MATQRILPERLPDNTGDHVSEACLIERLAGGSEDALAHLYCRHGAAVLAEATRTSRDRWIAAEVVQETFLALWNRAELFDPSRGLLRSWLLTIAHNRAVDYLRRTNRHDRDPTHRPATGDGYATTREPHESDDGIRGVIGDDHSQFANR